MKRYYYSTQPFISWVINTYFYGNKHYTYLAPFYPYKEVNPKSSNPFLIYQDLYMPWKDKDIYDKTVGQFRLNLRKGVMSKKNLGQITLDESDKLIEVCDNISIDFFYPVVYRVDIDLPKGRLQKTGSALVGSNEYFLPDLFEDEFDILFFDNWSDFVIVKELYENRKLLTSDKVLKILEGHYSV
jgi:hypothetical protein